MFEALFKQKSQLPLLKNFSDSHGQSLLAFAFSRLLNIDLLPRLRAKKHQMLYKVKKEDLYENLSDAIHGVIRWKDVLRYYDDMLRIIVSFYERKASPAHILLKIAALRNNNGLKRAALNAVVQPLSPLKPVKPKEQTFYCESASIGIWEGKSNENVSKVKDGMNSAKIFSSDMVANFRRIQLRNSIEHC
jgi:hypothetical protein